MDEVGRGTDSRTFAILTAYLEVRSKWASQALTVIARIPGLNNP